MAAEQEAGAILIALKAQIDGLQKGFAEAKKTLAGFGRDTQAAATGVQRAGVRISGTFGEIDRRAVQSTARIARFTQRLVSLQFAIGTFGQIAGQSLKRFEVQTNAVTAGLGTFASVVTLIPNKIGLVLGATAGLAAGFNAVAQSIEQIELKSKKLSQSLLGNLRRVGIAQGRSGAIEAIDPSQQGRLSRQIEQQEEAFRNIEGRLQAARHENDRGRGMPGMQGAAIRVKAVAEIARLEEESRGAFEELKRLNAELERSKGLETYAKAMTELNNQAAKLPELAKHGVIDALKLEEGQIDVLNKKIQLLLENRGLLAKSPEAQGGVDRAVAQLEMQRADLQFQQAFRTDDESQKRVAAEKLAVRTEEVDRLAQNFSGAIGDAMFDGIMQGKPAMEILADTGRNLFANFLGDSVKVFQEGMTSAFKAITGVAGVEIGGLLTGLVGVIGGILAKRGDKGSDSFSGIKSQIESSAAVRGIVAGPTTIATASVAEGIGREFVPIKQLLEAQLRVQVQMEGHLRAGRRQGGGGQSSVYVSQGGPV